MSSADDNASECCDERRSQPQQLRMLRPPLLTPSSLQNNTPLNSEEKLVSLSDRTGYQLLQENGQRRFGPPPGWNGPPPSKGCEVFVGKIPRDCFEDELVPVFSSIGCIYELRLMMDFSGTNRGYAFVMYTTLDDARKAIRRLNGHMVRPGKRIGVVKSVDNCRLFVGGIPKYVSREEVLAEMSNVTEGVTGVIVYSSPKDQSKNRGFAFVEYENHRSAAMARRRLIPGRILVWGQQLMVDWAEPEPEVDDETMSKVRVLYVRNVSELTSEEILEDFLKHMKCTGIEKVKKLRGFAFVHFATRDEAQFALHVHGSTLDGLQLEVTWAKPPGSARSTPNNRGRGIGPGNFISTSAITGPHTFAAENPLVAQSFTPSEIGHGTTNFTNYSRMRNRDVNGFRYSQFRFHGYPQPGCLQLIIPATNVVTPLVTFGRPTRKHPTQALTDLCRANGLPDPIFQINTSAAGAEDAQSDFNNETQLYQCKVSIPGFGHIQTPLKFFRSRGEAESCASKAALNNLEYIFYNNSKSPERVPQPNRKADTFNHCLSPLKSPLKGINGNGTYPSTPSPSSFGSPVSLMSASPCFLASTPTQQSCAFGSSSELLPTPGGSPYYNQAPHPTSVLMQSKPPATFTYMNQSHLLNPSSPVEGNLFGDYSLSGQFAMPNMVYYESIGLIPSSSTCE